MSRILDAIAAGDWGREGWIDIGNDHAYCFSQFAPDRDLNPQYKHVPDVPRYSALVAHFRPDDGQLCMGAIHFDTPEVRAVDEASRRHCEAKGIPYQGDYPRWTVQSWEPLTIQPSLLCNSTRPPDEKKCGDHGFITNGQWVRA